MNALALDLGLRSFGYAFNVGQRLWGGSVELGRVAKGKIGPGLLHGERPAQRYVYFTDWLNGFLSGVDIGLGISCDSSLHRYQSIDLVLYESPFQRYWTARRAMISLESRVEEFCARRHLPPPRPVNVLRLKKWVTAYPGGLREGAGYGRATKEQVMAAVKERWGYVALSDDEADAVALLHYGLAHA